MADDFEPVPYQGPYSEDDLELFGPYTVLYPILIEGRRVLVPGGISALRSCQYIEIKDGSLRMPWKDYCWNNTDGCCETTFRRAGVAETETKRACITVVEPGMEIVKLPKGGRSCKPRR